MKEQSAMQVYPVPASLDHMLIPCIQMLLPRQGVTIIPKEWMNSWGLKNPLEVLEKDPYSSGSVRSLLLRWGKPKVDL